jgi:hypothetical protein
MNVYGSIFTLMKFLARVSLGSAVEWSINAKSMGISICCIGGEGQR